MERRGNFEGGGVYDGGEGGWGMEMAGWKVDEGINVEGWKVDEI
jgi:hypothetical protein